MHMQINQAGGYHLTLTIDHLCTIGCREFWGNRLNFPIGKKHIRDFVAVIGRIHHAPALKQHQTHRRHHTRCPIDNASEHAKVTPLRV